MTLTEQRLLLAGMDRCDSRLYRERQRRPFASALIGWLIIFGVIFAAWVAMP